MSARVRRARRALLVLAVAGLACDDATAPEDADVRFQLDAVFCGGTPYAIGWRVDEAPLGTDTLAHGRTSRAYRVAPGRHVLGARLNGHAFTPDTTVTLAPGASLTWTVPLYCS